MKTTNKTLIFLAAFILVITSGILIYARIIIKFEPNEFINEWKTKTLDLPEFDSIVLNNRISAQVKQSDTLSVKIYGGDNLIDNYSKVYVKDKTLYAEIDSMMLDKERQFTLKIKMPKLKYLKLNDFSSLNARNFNSEILTVELNDKSSALWLKKMGDMENNCGIGELSVTANGMSIGNFQNVDKAKIETKDSSVVSVFSESGEVKGHQQDFSQIVSAGNFTKNEIIKENNFEGKEFVERLIFCGGFEEFNWGMTTGEYINLLKSRSIEITDSFIGFQSASIFSQGYLFDLPFEGSAGFFFDKLTFLKFCFIPKDSSNSRMEDIKKILTDKYGIGKVISDTELSWELRNKFYAIESYIYLQEMRNKYTYLDCTGGASGKISEFVNNNRKTRKKLSKLRELLLYELGGIFGQSSKYASLRLR